VSAIQLDYGEFDARFLGVNVRFHAAHPSTWTLFDEIGTEKRDPQKVFEAGRAALKESPERAFEVFSVGTVLTHEVRHFHDFILSPYGNALFRLRLTILLNGFQALLPLLGGRKTIPVPLPAWLAKGDAEKARLAEQWAGLMGGQTVEPFDLSDDEARLIDQTRDTYSRIKDFLFNPRTVSGSVSFQPYHLWEASAFITQVQNVYSVFGTEAVEAFTNFILNHPAAQPYSIVFRLLYELWQEAGVAFDAEVGSAVAAWCLLGDFVNDGWAACPTVRFARLYELLRKEGPPPRGDVGELFRAWTERLSYSPVETAIERNNASTQRFIDHLEQNAGNYPDFMAHHVSHLLWALKSLARANAHASRLFLSNPKGYVNPYDYVQNYEAWPSAPAVATFVGGGILIPKQRMEALQEQGIIIHNGKTYGEDQVIVFKVLFPKNVGGVHLIDAELALGLSDLLTMSDFFFSEYYRADDEFDLVRVSLREAGLTALEILT